MAKLAIFVEGQTEQIFTERLLAQRAKAHRVEVQSWKAEGSGARPRRLILLKTRGKKQAGPKNIMVVDSGGDTRVASDIRDNYAGLVANGYELILGIRDAYPTVRREEVSRLRQGLAASAPSGSAPVEFLLCVMEVEAWFIGEASHFQRLAPELTPSRIRQAMGFDPQRDDIQERSRPAEDLDRIYRLAGLRYHKTRASVERTVNALDFTRLSCHTRYRFVDLDKLFRFIEDFLAG